MNFWQKLPPAEDRYRCWYGRKEVQTLEFTVVEHDLAQCALISYPKIFKVLVQSEAVPLYPLWKMLFPNYVTTTECVGRAMLNVTKRGFPRPVLENRDMNRMRAKES